MMIEEQDDRSTEEDPVGKHTESSFSADVIPSHSDSENPNQDDRFTKESNSSSGDGNVGEDEPKNSSHIGETHLEPEFSSFTAGGWYIPDDELEPPPKPGVLTPPISEDVFG